MMARWQRAGCLQAILDAATAPADADPPEIASDRQLYDSLTQLTPGLCTRPEYVQVHRVIPAAHQAPASLLVLSDGCRYLIAIASQLISPQLFPTKIGSVARCAVITHNGMVSVPLLSVDHPMLQFITAVNGAPLVLAVTTIQFQGLGPLYPMARPPPQLEDFSASSELVEPSALEPAPLVFSGPRLPRFMPISDSESSLEDAFSDGASITSLSSGFAIPGSI